MTKTESVTLRLTRPEKADLQKTAELSGQAPGALASHYVREGVRRSRFSAIDFRDGSPGRVAYLTGSRWPVWLLVELAEEYGQDLDKVARHARRPAPLIKQALAYARAYPEEIAACRRLFGERDFAGLKAVLPHLEKL